jgi:N-acetylmuramic acid 6-phosphate etherase
MSEKPQAELGKLRTEQVDEKFHLLDIMSVRELLTAMNESDSDVPKAIALQLPAIERAIDVIVDRFRFLMTK